MSDTIADNFVKFEDWLYWKINLIYFNFETLNKIINNEKIDFWNDFSANVLRMEIDKLIKK